MKHSDCSAFDVWSGPSTPREDELPQSPKRQQLLLYATRALVATYGRCNPRFQFNAAAVPRRVLTKPSSPSVPTGGGGMDNNRGDLVLSVGDVLRGGGTRATYTVEDLIGSGTFGQVVRCRREVSGAEADFVAVKVVRNKPAYTKQGLIEIGIVEHLNRMDTDDRHHVVRMFDYFICKSHVCLVFELLSVNLYELLKSNGYRGLSTNLVRVFIAQLLDTCQLLRRNSVIHCDLKPENILLVSASNPAIKVIDYGSACYENHTAFSYIQSRFYRAPEVLLGIPYAMDIDMWSVGCIAAELYLGLPLFAGASELQQLRLIIEALGPMPMHMLLAGSKVSKYFNVDSNMTYTLKTDEEFSRENGVAMKKPNKRYFFFTSFQELVRKYPAQQQQQQQQQQQGQGQDNVREALAHFLSGLLRLDPMERWTPEQAARHPFVTGEAFDGEWYPMRRSMGASLFADVEGSGTYSPSSSLSSSFSPRSFQYAVESPTQSPRRTHSGSTLGVSLGNSVKKDSSARGMFRPPHQGTVNSGSVGTSASSFSSKGSGNVGASSLGSPNIPLGSSVGSTASAGVAGSPLTGQVRPPANISGGGGSGSGGGARGSAKVSALPFPMVDDSDGDSDSTDVSDEAAPAAGAAGGGQQWSGVQVQRSKAMPITNAAQRQQQQNQQQLLPGQQKGAAKKQQNQQQPSLGSSPADAKFRQRKI